MEITSSLILDLTVATGVICLMPAAFVAWRPQKPYTQRDFFTAMERIAAGVEELRALLDESAFCGPELIADQDARALRVRCKGVLKDMLRNGCFIVNRAEPCCRADFRRELERAEINRCAGEVVRQGLRLILYVRWSSLRLAFRAGGMESCELTMRAAEKYACLWMAVIAFLEAKFPECCKGLSAVG